MRPRAAKRAAARRAAAGLAAVPLLWAFAAAEPAGAKTLRVKTGSSAGPGSLRHAVARSNKLEGHDHIVYARSLRRDIQVRGRLFVRDALTITGRGREGPALHGRRDGQTLSGITFRTKDGKGRLVVERIDSKAVGVDGRNFVVRDSVFSGTGNAASGALYASGEAKVSDTTVTGWGIGVGAGIAAELTVEDSIVTDNRIGVDLYGADAEIKHSTISHNEGGIHLFYGTSVDVKTSRISGNSPDGGIHAEYYAGVHVERSTIAGNEAPLGGGISLSLAGATVTNSTISGNVATSADNSRGGGIYGAGGGSVGVRASTITENTAEEGGAIFLGNEYRNVDATIESSIVAGNPTTAGAECASTGQNPPTPLQPISEGGNVFGPAGCGTALPSDILSADPGLGPLADNGGPTRTHALLPGSPAIGHGLDLGLATDQRGVPRDSQPDSGSFEAP